MVVALPLHALPSPIVARRTSPPVFGLTPIGVAAPRLKALLPLVRYVPDRSLPLIQRLHIAYVLLPYIFITLPIETTIKHLLPFLTFGLWKSAVVRETGRWGLPDHISRITTRILCFLNPQQARAIFFSRTWMYNFQYATNPPFLFHQKWITQIEEGPVRGRWIQPPDLDPRDAEFVFFFVHGGGFVVDTGAPAQNYFMLLSQQLNTKRRRRVSIFQLDYELAPEYIWPSQIIEATAGYSYLVHKLGISPDRIVIGGDSAGANIVLSTLLHIARPCAAIGLKDGEAESSEDDGRSHKWLADLPWNQSKDTDKLQKDLRKPKGAFIMSPFISFLSRSPTHEQYGSFDYIDPRSLSVAALCYVGGVPPSGPSATFHPSVHFKPPFTPLAIEVPGVGKVWASDTRAKAGKGDVAAEKEILEKAVRVLATNPYVDPSLVGKGKVGEGQTDAERKKDELNWWKEALPEDGRTLACWGGKEIMVRDQAALVRVWDEAGLAPKRLVKKHGVHDWVLYDYAIPLAYISPAKGPESRLSYGVDASADWFETVFPEEKYSPTGTWREDSGFTKRRPGTEEKKDAAKGEEVMKSSWVNVGGDKGGVSA